MRAGKDATERSAEAPACSAVEALIVFARNAPMGVAVTDLKSKYLAASPYWLEQYGLTEADLPGRDCFELAPEFREKYEAVHARCLAGERYDPIPERCVGADGEVRYLTWAVGPWRDEAGEVGGLLIMSRDVTHFKRSEEEAQLNRAFLNTILENAPMPLAVKDAEGRVVLLNRAMEDLYGTSARDQLGKTIGEIVSDPEQAKAVEAEDRRALASPEPIVEEVETRTHRGEWRFVRKIKAPIRQADGATYLMTISQDLTGHKQAEEALRQAAEAAQAANVAKSEFLANMSHEIRTPLNGVMGLADALSRMELEPKQREIVEMIVTSGESLTTILSDVLDLAKAEAGQLSLVPEPFVLRDSLGATAFLFQSVARQKNIGFEVSFAEGCPERLVGDHVRINQVVSNLISNAVKFTSEGGVRVEVGAEQASDGRCRLTVAVRDTGPGFSEEVRAKLFSRFEQGDGSITRRYGGTGLGLSIASTLAAMMDGGIDCEAVPGEGATFVFQALLPLDRSEAAPVADSGAAVGGFCERPVRVLLAEDHEINQKVVQLMLGEAAELTITADGQACLDAYLAGERFDVVLMDTQMPVMDGLTATRAIRAEERLRGLPRTPIISLTANAMAHQVADCLNAGSDLHLAKPITADALYAAIACVLDETETSVERVA